MGYATAVVEVVIPHSKIKRDAFGIADLIAYNPKAIGTLYVQLTTQDHHAERVKKILRSEHADGLLQAGNRIVVISWRQMEGGTKWVNRWEEIRREFFPISSSSENGFGTGLLESRGGRASG